MHRYFLHIYFFTIFVAHFFWFLVPVSVKTCFYATNAAENAEVVQRERNKPNFRASEWENLFSLNERSRKCMCFINDIYAEFSCQ